jgi:cytochrome b561
MLPAALVLASIDGVRSWFERWMPLADWLFAAGTVVLALATFRVALRAREEATAVCEDADQVAAQVTSALARSRVTSTPNGGSSR